MRVGNVAWTSLLSPLSLLLVAAVVATARSAPWAEDSLAAEVVSLDDRELQFFQRLAADFPTDIDPFARRWSGVSSFLDADERACRSNLMSKEQEPGSPSLVWRALGRVVQEDATCFIGAVSCGDSLCGMWIHHDRLGVLCLRPTEGELSVYPREAVTIGDGGTEAIDSLVVARGADHDLIQVRRRSSIDHPCYSGVQSGEMDERFFVVLRSGHAVQALRIVASSYSSDESSASFQTGILTMTPESISLEYQEEEYISAGPGDTTTVESHAITDRGTLRYRYRADLGRFAREP